MGFYMITADSLDNPIFYLKNAKCFNGLWHKTQELLFSNIEMSETDKLLMSAEIAMYLAQKQSNQLTALRKAYDKAQMLGMDYDECGLVLALDPNEKGVSGEGVYYGLYPVGQFDLACHIPKESLLAGLTVRECQFFNL